MCKGEINIKTRKVFLCLVFIIALVLPVLLSSPVQAATNYEIQAEQDEWENIGTMEAMVTNIDPWGGVRNDLTSFQNATKYGYNHLDLYLDIVEDQASSENGFVSMAQLEISLQTTYPNGVIGGPMVGLTLLVNPIIVLATNPASSYVASPTAEEAITLADEVKTRYETDLGISLSRFSVTAQQAPASFYHWESDTYISDYTARTYQIQYLSLPDIGAGAAAMNALRTRLSMMGGFMDMVNAPSWPVDDSVVSETLFFEHHSDSYGYYSGMDLPLYFYLSYQYPFVRAASNHPDYVESFNLGVLGMAGFLIPSYIEDVAGDDSYSFKQHIGYGANIQSKGLTSSTIGAMSSIAAITPTGIDVTGPPSAWTYFDKDTDLGSPYGYTVDDIVKEYVILYPRTIGMDVASMIWSTGPSSFDSYIDSLWGSAGPFIDIRDMLLQTDYMEGAEYYDEYGLDPIEDLNQDLLRAVMENAGFTPDVLLSYIDDDIFDLSPTMALIEAFVKYFDSYHLLDILQDTTYSNPVVLEAFLNTYIQDIETFLMDFAGIDLSSSYTTKEAFADLIEDHFGLILQALFDAMADFTGDTTEIKDAVNDMLVTDHLISEIFPYFWTDLYSSFVTEYEYGLYLNFDPFEPYYPGDYPNLRTMDIADIVLEFDLDRESISYDGPHLIVDKIVADNELLEGEILDVTITVKNIGDAAAYDIKVLDGITPGFDADKQYYWNKAVLSAGDTWTLSVTTTATALGHYAEIPTIVCYFNATLSSFDPILGPEYWDGAAMYTISEVGNQIHVVTFLEQTVLGVPLYLVVTFSSVGVIVVLLILIKMRR